MPTETLLARLLAGDVYLGGGVAARVSKIDVLTKQYNMFAPQDRNAYISEINFLVDRTDNGQFAVDYRTSSSAQDLVASSAGVGSILGSSVVETTPYALYPYELIQERFWHSLYISAEGEVIQFRMHLNDQQLFKRLITRENFVINAFIINAEATSRLQ